jgi:predicted HTH transcriptional regulator
MVVFYGLHDVIEKQTNQANQDTNQASQDTNQVDNSSLDTRNRIISILENNSTWTQREIAEKLGVKLGLVKYYMSKMKKEGIIERIGTSQKGHWEVRKD